MLKRKIFDTVEYLVESLVEDAGLGKVAKVAVGKPTESASLGMASVPLAIEVKLVNEEKDPLSLFAKIAEKDGMSGYFNDFLKTFDKEIAFYEDILPRMAEFQTRRGKGLTDGETLSCLVPKYYGSGLVTGGTDAGKDKLVIIMEDIVKLGYAVTGRKDFHSLQQITASLTGIASWHATSYVMQVMEGTEWVREVPLLEEYFLAPRHAQQLTPWFSDTLTYHIQIITSLSAVDDNLKIPLKFPPGLAETLVRIRKFIPDVFHLMSKIGSHEGPFNVVCHGDFHMWNVAFLAATGRVKFFDLQIHRFSSSLTDVHHYLSQVSTPAMRKEHLHEYLDVYRETFSRVCLKLGLPSSDPIFKGLLTTEGLLHEYSLKSLWGFVCAAAYVLPRFIIPSQKDSFFTTMPSDAEAVVEHVNNVDDGTTENIWFGIQVFIDIVEEYRRLGTLDVVEDVVTKWQTTGVASKSNHIEPLTEVRFYKLKNAVD